MKYETLIVTQEDGVATIKMNRPQQMNAMNRQMLKELIQAIEDGGQDSAVKVMVITGAGDKAFSVGLDLTLAPIDAKSSAESWGIVGQGPRLFVGVRNVLKPVIAAVNGVAAGGGCALALASDIIIAAENARFRPGFVAIGLQAEGGLSYILPNIIGVARACEILFTGRIVDATEAEKLGLVNQVVPATALEATVKKLAATLAKGPSLAIGLQKACIYRGLAMDLPSVTHLEAVALSTLMATQDFKEGVTALFEKREPVFKGK